MNRRFSPSDELADLMQKLLDDQLTKKQHDRLEALLIGNPDAQAFFTELLQLHAVLHEQAIAVCFGDQSGALGSDHFVSMTASVPSDVSKIVPAGQPWLNRLIVFAPWVLAASLMIALVYSWQGLTPSGEPLSTETEVDVSNTSISRPPAVIATLDMNSKAVWANDEMEVGRAFHEGETLQLDKGQARISIGCGAEVVARGPCKFTFVSADRVHLEQGTLLVDVADWAKGFTVVTDGMEVIDLGTTFEVAANPGSVAKTTVLKGLVRALPATNPGEQRRSVLLTEGEGLKVDKEGNHRTFNHNVEEELSQIPPRTIAMYRPVDLSNTGLDLAEGDEDPNWRVINGPQEGPKWPVYAEVCVPYKRYLSNDPDESQWISIRNWEEAASNSVYTFQTSFDLHGYDLSTMRLFGRFLADNGIEEVRVNGEAVKVESWVDNVYGQRFEGSQFRFVNVTEGLVHVRNTIEVDVFNGTTVNRRTGEPVPGPNHMALRVEWYAFGRQEIATGNGEALETRYLLPHRLTRKGLPSN